jgi:TATA-box binding protein (TBP) (component of TFIID and TFIIIB)
MQSSVQLPVVKNVKIHFKVADISRLNTGIADLLTLKLENTFPISDTLTRKHNFCVFKRRFVYIIFYNTGFVNCTKIRNYSEISAALEEFSQVFKLDLEYFSTPIIDNTTSSGSFDKVIYLNKLKEKIQAQNVFQKVNFNPEHFPGLFIKTNNGTIIVFHSGKYTIIGAKCQQQADTVFSQVHACILQ